MKIESTDFTATEIMGFVDELQARDRDDLVRRLEAVERRLEDLRPRLEQAADAGGGGEGWTGQEVLAHLAVLSKFYGVIAYRIASGKLTEFDLLGQVRLRDVAGEAAAGVPAAALLDGMAADHRRTLEFLRSVAPGDLRRSAATGVGGIAMTAADVLRLPLVCHLEGHLEQLEAAIT